LELVNQPAPLRLNLKYIPISLRSDLDENGPLPSCPTITPVTALATDFQDSEFSVDNSKLQPCGMSILPQNRPRWQNLLYQGVELGMILSPLAYPKVAKAYFEMACHFLAACAGLLCPSEQGM
jgi:hypothetical protein